METNNEEVQRIGKKRKRNYVNDGENIKRRYETFKNVRERIFNTFIHQICKEDTYQKVNNDTEFKDGVKRIKKFLYFCLIVVKKTYKLTSLQYRVLLKTIPTVLPVLFGKEYYRSNINEIHNKLGTLHRKLFFLLIGARRDGKSIIQSIIVTALFICSDNVQLTIPIFGPVQTTGERVISNIDSIFKLDDVKKFLGDEGIKTKPSIKKILIKDKSGNIKQGIAMPSSDNAIRGLNSDYDVIDEFESVDEDIVQSQLFARYGEYLGGMAVTNLNPHSLFFQNIRDSISSVIEIENHSLVCKSCRDRAYHFKSNYELLKRCQELQHIDDESPPQRSKKLTEGWNKHMSQTHIGREQNIGNISDSVSLFDANTIDMFFDKKSTVKDFQYFALGCDPSAYGKSKTAISIFGVEKINTSTFYHLLNVEEISLNEDDSIPLLVHGIVQKFYNHMVNLSIIKECNDSKYRKLNIKCLNWIESNNGNHGYVINKMYKCDRNLKHCCTVMKAKEWEVRKRKGKFKSYGIAKTKETTENYVKYTTNKIREGTLCLHDDFFTASYDRDTRSVLLELKKQMIRFTRTDKNKITGKGPNGTQNDDILISFIMTPFNTSRALTPNFCEGLGGRNINLLQNYCLNKQVTENFNELSTFSFKY